MKSSMSILAIAFAIMLVAACSRGPFGSSYDECLLRNATKGGDGLSRQIASDVCLRHFARTPTPAENQMIAGAATPMVYHGSTNDYVIVNAQNHSPNLLVVEVGAVVEFHSAPADASGAWSDDGQRIFWTFPAQISPRNEAYFTGTFSAPGGAPSPNFDVGHVYATKVVVLGEPGPRFAPTWELSRSRTP